MIRTWLVIVTWTMSKWRVMSHHTFNVTWFVYVTSSMFESCHLSESRLRQIASNTDKWHDLNTDSVMSRLVIVTRSQRLVNVTLWQCDHRLTQVTSCDVMSQWHCDVTMTSHVTSHIQCDMIRLCDIVYVRVMSLVCESSTRDRVKKTLRSLSKQPHQKNPSFPIKRALFFLSKEPYIPIKRALHSLSKQPYIHCQNSPTFIIKRPLNSLSK